MSSWTRFRTLLAAAALWLWSPSASALEPDSVGGRDGEIDTNIRFTAMFGDAEPTERDTTHHSAGIEILEGGVGYSLGRAGPLRDLYLRLEGGYFTSDEEVVENPDDDLPVGYRFYGRDRGGWVTARVSASFVSEHRYSFAAFAEGTVPIDVELAKFSSVQLHYGGGGVSASIWLTDPDRLLRLGFSSRHFVGSGAYLDGEQHNAQLRSTNLFVFEAARWALPWRAGVLFGPLLEADLNDHVDLAYNNAYASVTPDLVAGDRIRMMRLALDLRPFILITDHAAVELGFTQTLLGYDVKATQIFHGGVRTAF